MSYEGTQAHRRANPVCGGTGKIHRDAEKVVEFLLDANGAVKLPNGEIARKLGFLKNQTKGVFILDTGRFQRARSHLNDCHNPDGKPCCHFNVNYRKAGAGESVLALIDPDGTIDDHWRASVATVLGVMSRERQHQTEIVRCMGQVEDLADFALTSGDKAGYRICQRVITDLDHYSTIHGDTLGEFIAWAEGLAASP